MERLDLLIQKSQAFFFRVLGFLPSLFAHNNCLKLSRFAHRLNVVCAVWVCPPKAAFNVVSESLNALLFNTNNNKGG